MPPEVACCILELCCGDGPKQQEALTEWLRASCPSLNEKEATQAATALCASFDFAPKGTLKAFKDAIRAEVLAHPEYE